MDKEIAELQKRFEAKKQELETSKVSDLVKAEIENQYAQNTSALTQSEDFKNLTQEIVKRKAQADLSKDMLEVLNEEQKNALAKFVLDCEKEKLEFRKKKEKKIIIEEIKADLFNKKVEALKKKYGYLYKRDENGDLIGFVPNKIYNKYASFCNWWANTTDGFKKIVKGTLKVVFWVGVAGLAIVIGYNLFEWISNATANLPKT